MNSGNVEESGLREFLQVLGRRLPIVLAAVVIVPAAALAFSLGAEKQYTATAKLLFRDPGFDQKVFGSSVLAPSADPAREAATNVGLVSLDTISARAARALRDANLTPSQIRDKVKVAAEGQSNVISVRATDPSPSFAARLANTIARQYIVFRRDADRSKINEAVALVRGQLATLRPAQRAGPEGRAIKAQVDQLKLLASLQTGNAELVQPARPPRSASSPKPVRNTLLGLLVGIAIGVGLAVLLDRLDRRLRHRSDAEAILERPVLGTIPESRALHDDGGAALHLSGPEGEAFRTLRTNLRYFDLDRDARSLLVTSCAPGDGKSTVARYLAATAAASNVRVILVEADLRRPTLNEVFPALRTPGLSDALSGQAAPLDLVQTLALEIVGRSSDLTLDVIVAGPLPPNPTDLLESERMSELLIALERRYELVVIDSSPVTVVPDSIPMLGRVGGVLIVVRDAKSTRAAARNLRKQLDNLGITPLGIVINGAPLYGEGAYYYGYYGYTPPEEPAPGPGQDGSSNGARPRRWP
ncbi:MAG: polysaccharide biosynthesis tyrosine autokinase, partial [Solirubrobacteraceae bacterium]